eukprot:gb/GFBE01038121.1/.p1 GENE.gb/GFBE01038121.1/~~gb/GFBE01038121.1/.p1  ORF type:complete len:181 (+),score=30.76 gb/GFBE01038121.1/:1-543(+)
MSPGMLRPASAVAVVVICGASAAALKSRREGAASSLSAGDLGDDDMCEGGACAFSALQTSAKTGVVIQSAAEHRTCKPARPFECRRGEYQHDTEQCCLTGKHTCVPAKYTFECKNGHNLGGLCCMEGTFTCLPVKYSFNCKSGDYLDGQCCMKGALSCEQVDYSFECSDGIFLDGQCCKQ